MYHLLYNLVFGLDVTLIVFDIGVLAGTVATYWRKRNHARTTRYYFGGLCMLNGGLAYLFAGAIYSLFKTSNAYNDPSIFFFPPGLALVGWGALRKLIHYSRGGKL
jgi:hypothetical protein